MMLTVIQCKTDCKRVTIIGTYDTFRYSDSNGVYICPICKGKNIETVLRPFEIEEPVLKIKGGNLSENTAIAATLAREARQGQQVSTFKQLYSPGRRDDEPGEGTPQKLEEPIIDGIVVPRPRPSISKYEVEVSQYFGICPETDVVLPPG